MYEELLVAFGSAEGASDTVYVQHFSKRQYVLAQVDISSAATVTLQGRASDLMEWIDIHEFTATDAIQATAFPQMRFDVVGNDGVIDAVIWG